MIEGSLRGLYIYNQIMCLFSILGAVSTLEVKCPTQTYARLHRNRAHTLTNSEIHPLSKCYSFPTTVLEDLLQNELTPFFYDFISLVLLFRGTIIAPADNMSGSCFHTS
jgi:hypothetical protein